jgi:hypothetical protein
MSVVVMPIKRKKDLYSSVQSTEIGDKVILMEDQIHFIKSYITLGEPCLGYILQLENK